jgi:hypothetical protein
LEQSFRIPADCGSLLYWCKEVTKKAPFKSEHRLKNRPSDVTAIAPSDAERQTLQNACSQTVTAYAEPTSNPMPTDATQASSFACTHALGVDVRRCND